MVGRLVRRRMELLQHVVGARDARWVCALSSHFSCAGWTTRESHTVSPFASPWRDMCDMCVQSLRYGQRAARPVAPGERLRSARGSIPRPGVGRGSRNAVCNCMENSPFAASKQARQPAQPAPAAHRGHQKVAFSPQSSLVRPIPPAWRARLGVSGTALSLARLGRGRQLRPVGATLLLG